MTVVSRRILVFFLTCCWASSVSAQQEDLCELQAERLLKLHDSVTAARLRFVCGPLYTDPYGRNEGHPFLGTGSWQQASLEVNGHTFGDVPVKYDICNDQVVYFHSHSSGNYPIILHKQRIGAFTMDGMHFVHFFPGRSGIGEAESGFYQEIITGKAGYYVRWYKRYTPHSTRPGGNFIRFRYAYVLRGDTLYRIRNRRDLAVALQDRSREVRNYIRRNHLVIGSEDGSGLSAAIRYYNSLGE